MRPTTGMSRHEDIRPMTGTSQRDPTTRPMTGMSQRHDESTTRPSTGVPRPATGISRHDDPNMRPSTGVSRLDQRPATGVPRQDDPNIQPSTGVARSDHRASPNRTMTSVTDESPPPSHRSRARGGSQSPLKFVNEYPPEGITQFCRQDSGSMRHGPENIGSRHSSLSSTLS